jgi:hypothetical protein
MATATVSFFEEYFNWKQRSYNIWVNMQLNNLFAFRMQMSGLQRQLINRGWPWLCLLRSQEARLWGSLWLHLGY